MEQVRFGRTGLRVSRLCLGTMTFGLQCDVAQSNAIMDAAAEGGMADFAVSGWYGLVAPAKTPKAIIDRVNAEAIKALKDPKVLERLAHSGSLPIGEGPEKFDAHIRAEIARWNKVLTAAGVQPTN